MRTQSTSRSADLSLQADASGLRVGVVVSRYHDEIVSALADGAVRTFLDAGGAPDRLVRVDAPGAFELPVVAAALARSNAFDAVVCLGLVLTGETSHDRHIADSVAHALQTLAIETGKPVGFGLLTCQTYGQAQARAGGDKGNKGEEAMRATILAVAAVRAARRAVPS